MTEGFSQDTSLKAHPGKKPMPKRIVGVDYGFARIGLALSDESQMIASPMMTFKCEKKLEETIAKLVSFLLQHASSHHYEIEEIVIGLPLMMSGKLGVIGDEVLHFVQLLREKISPPIITWDERLTTVQADRSLRESQLSRKKRASVVDVVAASIILQGFLDHKRFKRTSSYHEAPGDEV